MSSPRKVLRSSENVSEPIHVRGSRKVIPTVAKASAKVAKSPDQTVKPAGPPKPPRSAFMCFTDAKKKAIMIQRGLVKDKDDILKIVAQEWKALSDRDRAHWDEEARNDKVRFVREKAAYKGPWSIPKRRAKKHPLAPKRPMSAFLKYSQTRRAKVKKENPDMSNTDVSRLLGEMWRNASPKERAPYVGEEERERAIYKEEIKKWKDDQARMDAASRTSHQSVRDFHHHYERPFAGGPERPYAGGPERPYAGGPERPYAGGPESLENLHIDSFEEPVKHGGFHQQSSNLYPSYRQTFPSASDASLHEYHEADPMPGSRPPLSTHPNENEELIGDHFATSMSRSGYFQDHHRSLGYYSRYP